MSKTETFWTKPHSFLATLTLGSSLTTSITTLRLKWEWFVDVVDGVISHCPCSAKGKYMRLETWFEISIVGFWYQNQQYQSFCLLVPENQISFRLYMSY